MRLRECLVGWCWMYGTALGLLTTTTMAFTVPMIHPQPSTRMQQQPAAKISTVLSLATEKQQSQLPDIDAMKASEMKKELESYGVSTKSLLEKSDFVKALHKAREEGMQPSFANDENEEKEVEEKNENTEPKSSFNSTNTTTSTSKNANAAAAAESSTTNGESTLKEDPTITSSMPSRQEKYEKAMVTAKSMKVAELKKELQDRGISTGTFLEKSDFVKAYAEAIADDVPKTTSQSSSSSSTSSSSSSSSSKTKGSTAKKQPEEPMDPSYRDVVTQKFDKRRLMGQSVIDISIR